MRKIAYVASLVLFTSFVTPGCFSFHKEEKQVPSSHTTIERQSSVEVPSVESDVVHKRTTVESTY